MPGFVADDRDLLPIRQESSPSIVDMLYTVDLDRTRLAGANGQHRNLTLLIGWDCDCPLSVGREAARTAFSQPNREGAVDFAKHDRVSGACGLASVLKKHGLAVT